MGLVAVQYEVGDERAQNIAHGSGCVEQTEHPAAESGTCQLGRHHWLEDPQHDLA